MVAVVVVVDAVANGDGDDMTRVGGHDKCCSSVTDDSICCCSVITVVVVQPGSSFLQLNS